MFKISFIYYKNVLYNSYIIVYTALLGKKLGW